MVIDGVTIYLSADDLKKGSITNLSEALRKLADDKEEELESIQKTVMAVQICERKLAQTDEKRNVFATL